VILAMRRRRLCWLGFLVLMLLAGIVTIAALRRVEYSDSLVSQLGACQTVDQIEAILGRSQHKEKAGAGKEVVYYWHLSSRDARLDWAVQAIADENRVLTQIAYIPVAREPSFLERWRRWFGL
jgi:hypothetical protein